MMICVCGIHLMTSCDNFLAYFGLLLKVLCVFMCVTSLHFSRIAILGFAFMCVCDIFFTFFQIVAKGFVIVCVCVCVCVGMCNLVLIKKRLGVLLPIVL